jgi:hypothetical protein
MRFIIHYKMIKIIFNFWHTNRKKNMAKTLNFVYVIILYFFLFVVAKRVDCGELFFFPFQISYAILIVYLSLISNIFYSIFFITGYTNLIGKPVPCDVHWDCPQIWSRGYECIDHICVVSNVSTRRRPYLRDG